MWICVAHLKEITNENSAATPLKMDYPNPAIHKLSTSNKSNKPNKTSELACSP
jgi:hypothetical protein